MWRDPTIGHFVMTYLAIGLVLAEIGRWHARKHRWHPAYWGPTEYMIVLIAWPLVLISVIRGE